MLCWHAGFGAIMDTPETFYNESKGGLPLINGSINTSTEVAGKVDDLGKQLLRRHRSVGELSPSV